jgi:hypothetical protein
MAGRSDDEALRRLGAALGDLAARDADALLLEAEQEARARVRGLLTEALSESMLSAVERVLDSHGAPPTSTDAAYHGAPPTSTDAASEPGIAGTEPGTALYIYGVVSSLDVDRLPNSLAGEPVHAVRQDELAAIVGEVALADYSEETLRAHLADLAWVERTARRHEGVLEALAEQVTVIPMRMCTVYEAEEGLRELLRRERQPLREALTYLDGKSEWGVKVFCDPGARTAAGESEEPERSASGAEYMQRRLREREARMAATREVEEAAARVHGRLCTVAADAMLAPVQRPEASGRSQEMIMNGVYLVSYSARDEFDGQVRALADEVAELGLELEQTGPWPAYNFVPGTIGAAW